MSIQAMTWAITQKAGGPAAKAVLWSISNYADKMWCAFLSQQTIAEESEQSVDSVQRRLPELEHRALVRRIPLRFAGRRSIDFFILPPSPLFDRPLDELSDVLPRGYVPIVVPSDGPRCSQSGPENATASCGSVGSATANATANATATLRQQDSLEPRNQESIIQTRAREPLVSAEAVQVAQEIACVAGVGEMAAWPPGWCGAPMRVEQFLRDGYHPEVLLIAAREVMAARRDAEAPWSIEYFAKAFAKARGRQKAGLPPIPEIKQTTNPSGRAAPRPGSREDRQERTTNARRKLREYAYGPHSNGEDRCGEDGGPLSGGLCLPKPA